MANADLDLLIGGGTEWDGCEERSGRGERGVLGGNLRILESYFGGFYRL